MPLLRSLAVRRLRAPAIFVLILLAIEFLDELVFGAREVAWPLIRNDLNLSYEQVGLLLSVPSFVGNLIEPALGILGDIWKRRVIVLVGGGVFALAGLMTASSDSFGLLMIAFILFSPASGAFVGLAQSTLMDLDPTRHEQNMARWTLAGSLGVIGGTLAIGGLVAVGLGWRALFLIAAIMTLVLLVFARRIPFASPDPSIMDKGLDRNGGFVGGVRNALHALRRREVLRWLTLLQFSDLMLDFLHGYMALYFVDVVGVSEAQAGVAIAIWTGVGLLGDLVMIPLLERVRGLSYLRVSAVIELILFTAFLLVPGLIPKLILLALIGVFNAGWYSILQGQLYSSMPNQSGMVMTVGNVAGLIGSLIPLGIGLVADRVGLGIGMWLFLLGPVALLVGLPRAVQFRQKANDESR
jgi:FSR family fosmidomycin resistance protein-like MFS transporter